MSANPFNDQLWAQVCQAFDDGWDYGVQEKFNHKGKRAEGLRRAIAALDDAGYAVVKTWPNQEMCSVLYKSRSEQIQPFEGVDCWASHVIKRLVEAAKETP